MQRGVAKSVHGRRGSVVHEALLRAALDELAEKGYADFSMEAVAARVGVHKTTVYRRWSDREALLAETVLSLAADEFSVPDTGEIDRDLRQAALNRAAWLTGPYGQPLVRMLGSDAAHLPGVREAIDRILATRQPATQARLDAAIAADQLPEGVSAERLLGTLLAPLYFALLVTKQPLTDVEAIRAADVTLAAARVGLLNA